MLLSWLLAAAVAALPVVTFDATGLTIVHAGKTGKVPLVGVRGVRPLLMPRRADGTELALWATVDTAEGERGMLIALGEAPTILYSLVPVHSVPRIETRTTNVWFVDVDGDGWNDALEFSTTFSDVGPQRSGAIFQRFDPATGRFVLTRRRAGQRLPGTHPSRVRLNDLFAGRKVEPRGRSDGYSVPLGVGADPPQKAVGLASTDPPYVGKDVLFLAIEKGTLHLVHAVALPKLALVKDVELGPIRFGTLRCDETLAVRDGAVVVAWSPDGTTMHEQRVPWDGRALSAPAAAASVVRPCAAR